MTFAKIRSFIEKHEWIIPLGLFILFLALTLPGISWGAPVGWHPDEIVVRSIKPLHGEWKFSEINRPLAYRAVGAANAMNPMPLVIPCHRVIGADQTPSLWRRRRFAYEGMVVENGRGRDSVNFFYCLWLINGCYPYIVDITL